MIKKIKHIFIHLITVIKHKWIVLCLMTKCGYFWRGLIHDMSKFSWIEFSESCKYSTGKRSPILEIKDKQGYSLAWLHHKGRNKHHFDFWVDNNIAIKIPYKYIIELICDYIAAAKVYLGKNFSWIAEYEWWINKLQTEQLKINNESCDFITECLKSFSDINEFNPFVFKEVDNKLNYSNSSISIKDISQNRFFFKPLSIDDLKELKIPDIEELDNILTKVGYKIKIIDFSDASNHITEGILLSVMYKVKHFDWYLVIKTKYDIKYVLINSENWSFD